MKSFSDITQSHVLERLPEPEKARVTSALKFLAASHEISTGNDPIAAEEVRDLQIRHHLVDYMRTLILNTLPLGAFADASPEKQLYNQTVIDIENVRSALSQRLMQSGSVALSPNEAEQAMVDQLRVIAARLDGHEAVEP